MHIVSVHVCMTYFDLTGLELRLKRVSPGCTVHCTGFVMSRVNCQNGEQNPSNNDIIQ